MNAVDTQTAVPPVDQAAETDLTAAVVLFRSLADPTRLAIARRLAVGEARVVDLTQELGLAQSTVSSHLACLRDCGLVDYRPVGRSSLYRLSRPELLDLLSSAETLLENTGGAVTLCPPSERRPYGKPNPRRNRERADCAPRGVRDPVT